MCKVKSIIAVIVAMLLLVGCNNNEYEVNEEDYKDCRFEVTYKQDNGALGLLEILRDKETGKSYLVTKNGYSGGVCELYEVTADER